MNSDVMVEFAGVINYKENLSNNSDVLKQMLSTAEGVGKKYYFQSKNFGVAKKDEKSFETNGRYLIVIDGILLNEIKKNQIPEFKNFEGYFSFLLWDESSKKLIISEDKFGSHPVYYTITKGKLIFGNDVKYLLSHPEVETKEDFFGVNEYLTLMSDVDDGTLFRNIKRVSPGKYLEVNGKKVQKKEYWEIKVPKDKNLKTPKDMLEILEKTIIKLVENGEEVGVALSGGIDSSLIVDILSRKTDTKISTFTIAFEDKEMDESHYADQIAKKYKTIHKKITLYSKDLVLDAPDAIWNVGNDTHVFLISIKNRLVSMVNQKMKLFKGNGADELFHSPKSLKYLTMFKILPFYSFKALKMDPPNLLPFNFRKFIEFQIANSSVEKMSVLSSALDCWERQKIYSNDYKRFFNKFVNLNKIEHKINSIKSLYDKRAYLSLKTFESNQAFVINSRLIKNGGCFIYPYLYPDVVNASFRIPPNLKFDKYFLKKISSGHLPSDIIERRKIGFMHPMRKMVQEQWDIVESYIYKLSERKYFSEEGIKKVLKQRKDSDIYFERNKFGYDNRVLDLLFGLELWFETFIDPEKPKKLKGL